MIIRDDDEDDEYNAALETLHPKSSWRMLINDDVYVKDDEMIMIFRDDEFNAALETLHPK